MWIEKAAAGLGVLVVGFSALRIYLQQRASPGRLVAEPAVLEWGGPSPDKPEEERADRPTFVLSNAGGSPVQILSAESSCGCAPPRLSAKMIPAGGRAAVTVEPQPIDVGERDVSITVDTDSPVTPRVQLQLRLSGSRKPPYLLRASGDLNFRWEDDPSDAVREVFIETVETPGRTAAPKLTSDLAFLRFGTHAVEEFPHHSDPKLIVKAYRVPVTLTSPPTGTFVGEVVVTDPWSPSHVRTILVQGQAVPPLRAIPPRVVLRVGDAATSVRFFVKSRGLRPDLHLIDHENGPAPLLIAPVGSADPDGLHAYDIRWNQGEPIREGIYRIRAEIASSPPQEITIPVMVKANVEVADR